MAEGNKQGEQNTDRTPIEFVLVTLERYLEEVIKPAYKKRGGLQQHHLLLLTWDHLYKPVIFHQTQLAPVMANAVMEELRVRCKMICAYILFADGFEIDLKEGETFNPLGRIEACPDKRRVLKTNVYFKEGSLSRTYQLRLKDEKSKAFEVLQDSQKDYWFRPEEELYGFHNPFFSAETVGKLAKEDVESVVTPIQKELEEFVKSKRAAKASDEKPAVTTNEGPEKDDE